MIEQSHTMNKRGSLLVALMIIMVIISTTTATALWTLKSEIHGVSADYWGCVARLAAESGIELAKRDLFSGGPRGSAGKRSEFQYGNEYFPQAACRIIRCRVKAYRHQDRVYLESKAYVRPRSDDGGRAPAVAESTVKMLIKVEKAPLRLSTLWRISD